MTDKPVSAAITAIVTELDVDDSIGRYATILAEELQRNNIRVISPQRTAAACLLIACRLREQPVRVTVIADRPPFSKEQIIGEMQRLSQRLEIEVPLADPETLIETCCEELALPDVVRKRAMCLARTRDAAGATSGVSPYTYAAAVLYVVCSPTDVELSQADLASHFDISTATLRKRRDNLLEATGSKLFEIQFPNASPEAVSFVDELLAEARTTDWARNKRCLGILAGAWLYVANAAEIATSTTELATVTGVGESTIRARYEDFVEHMERTDEDPVVALAEQR
ncbi:transcription initiation factor IIB [Natrinema sp. CBA1119]|uniref:transcription initiation factor IIB family protein n=1 Tax=Natrinema sp. CBA1119 TaxID=1608465 RepID=UPI000BF34C31|nr:transcription initiation factor IIB family protein [Natrinema sp. CBA1119]PGF14632.1 transcription initiation factor IIB [Natrinema sp. CBA1119]